MATLQLVATSMLPGDLGWTNCAFVTPDVVQKLGGAMGIDAAEAVKKGVFAAVGDAVLFVKANEKAEANKIHTTMFHRTAGNLPTNVASQVTPYLPPSDYFALASVELEFYPLKVYAGTPSVDASELAGTITAMFNKHVFKIGQTFGVKYRPGEPEEMTLRCKVKTFDFMDGSGAKAASQPANLSSRFGQLLKVTAIQLSKEAGPNSANVKMTGSSTGKANQLFTKGFNFEELGIGGLDQQFKDIFRRAFASRLVPPDILRKMGQNHVRGMLLFGPPGCGKTLIARKIGKALHAKPPKIVNGPEILNKFVGQSEENIRALFADAEKEQMEKGDDSELHIIIFDEFDAIAKQRGTSGGGTGVNDSIVNQLLSKIDGVDALNNILLIAMTNRKDMIDDAILRPGRLELHVEIGLPDEAGRVQILNIHTAELRKNGMLGADVSVEDIAARTKNYTGAEVEGLVKAACSYVFARAVDPTDLTKAVDYKGMVVTMTDFERALSETQPAFGVKEEELAQCCANGIIHYGQEFDQVFNTLTRLAHEMGASDRTPLLSVLLDGPSGCGKSALAAKIASNSSFPFIKRVSGESLLRFGEEGKAHQLQRVFNDAYKSPMSMIILDDIERIIEYVAVGPRFSNHVLQTLLVLTKALPPPGHKLMIIGTTAVGEMLHAMEVTNAFQLHLNMPMLESEAHYKAVLSSTSGMGEADVSAVAKSMAGKTTAMKKLLNVLEMAKGDATGQAKQVVTADDFYESSMEWGL